MSVLVPELVCQFHAVRVTGVQNVEFHSGKAEDVLPQLMINETAAQVIGIIDPPRGGLRKAIIPAFYDMVVMATKLLL